MCAVWTPVLFVQAQTRFWIVRELSSQDISEALIIQHLVVSKHLAVPANTLDKWTPPPWGGVVGEDFFLMILKTHPSFQNIRKTNGAVFSKSSIFSFFKQPTFKQGRKILPFRGAHLRDPHKLNSLDSGARLPMARGLGPGPGPWAWAHSARLIGPGLLGPAPSGSLAPLLAATSF
jgi:hypothetical protein